MADIEEASTAHPQRGKTVHGEAANAGHRVLAPDDAEVRLLHALALLRQGGISEAAEELHQTALALPDDAEIQLLAALACAAQSWDGEAWDALARAEGASTPAESALLREVEEAIDAGADAAQSFLVAQLAPALLRERLFERS